MDQLIEAIANIFGRALFTRWGCAIFLLLAGGIGLLVWLENLETVAR